MAKTLVVYYSLDGNCKLIAEAVAEAAGAKVLRVSPVKDITLKGFFKYFVGGMQASMKKRPELKPFDENPLDYDTVFVGSPVWGSNMTPAIRSFLTRYDWTGRKLAFFTCSGGPDEKVLGALKALVPGAKVLGTANFVQPLTNDKRSAVERAKREASAMLKK